MKVTLSSIRLNQLTRSLLSQSNKIWSFNVFWCRFVTPQTEDKGDCQHKHFLYEMHIATTGSLYLSMENESERELKADQFILIPPQISHSLRFATPSSSKMVLAFSLKNVHTSIKSALSLNTCKTHEVSPCMTQMINAVRPKLPESNELTPHILSYLLQGIVLEALDIIAPMESQSWDGQADDQLLDKRIEQANGIIINNILYPISGESLAHELNISLRQLNRLFHAAYGCSVNRRIQELRISYAQDLLNTTALSLTDIAENMQYSSVYSFIRSFTQIVGVSPGKYRNSLKTNR